MSCPDYPFLHEWPGMTSTELHKRMCAFRAYRQSKRQDTATAVYLKKVEEREQRKIEARSGTVDVSEYR